MLIVNCPTCKNQLEWSDKNPYKPFCSKRCKLIDLGEWASESHVIKGENLKQELVSQIDEFELDEQLGSEDNFFL